MTFPDFRRWLLLALAALLAPAPSQAALNYSCTVTTTPVNFGSYSLDGDTPLTTVGKVSVTCGVTGIPLSTNVSYTVTLNSGAGGNVSNRAMKSGSNTLRYNLYTSVNYSAVWGDGSGGSSVRSDAYILSGALRSKTTDYPVYGRIPASQNVAPGTYSDTIIVTVTY